MRESIAILRMHIRMGTFEWSMVSNFVTGMGRLTLLRAAPFLLSFRTKFRYYTRLKNTKPECLSGKYCTNCGCHTRGMLMTNEGCKIKCYD